MINESIFAFGFLQRPSHDRSESDVELVFLRFGRRSLAFGRVIFFTNRLRLFVQTFAGLQRRDGFAAFVFGEKGVALVAIRVRIVELWKKFTIPFTESQNDNFAQAHNAIRATWSRKR